MAKPCPNNLSEAIEDLDGLLGRSKARFDELVARRDSGNIRDQVATISLARILKYTDAFLLLVRNGYGEPAACLLRSVFEGYLWIRWSLLSAENAQTYFDSGKGEGIRLLEKLISRGLFEARDRSSGKVPDKDLIRTMLKDELKGSRPPKWDDMAKQAGLSDIFVLIYPMLSGMAHGSLLFLGERMERGTVSPDANWDSIEPFLPMAHNLVLDSLRVTEHWILHRENQPPPAWTSRDSFGRE